MKVLLHAGLDKAGSTAIQAHLHANRDWLLERGIYLPNSGLTRYGHRKLFPPDPEPGLWDALAEELALAAKSGYPLSVLSYEGAASLRRPEIAQLTQHLEACDLTFLFYLRDQAEVLQSGYLQNLKAGPQALSIDQLRRDHRRLPLASRDYSRLLARFRAAAGGASIRLRPFARDRLEGGDVVDDLLAVLDLRADAGFARLQLRQNPSLDVPSARLLNALDTRGTQEGRAALVDDLLWIIRRDGPQQKWFLDREAVTLLRQHYRPSNEQVLRDFNLAATADDFFGLDSMAWSESEPVDTGRVEAALHSLQRWPRWNGKECSEAALTPLLAHGGWEIDPDNGYWTCGQRGLIRFRVPLSRYAQRPRDLLLRVRGSYAGACCQSEIIINGRFRGALSLIREDVSLASSELGRDREVVVELTQVPAGGPSAPQFHLRSLELLRA